ncbi:MAG: hypothetical protein MI861_11670 [Pirellulales bacterium]|nr:hypothetical protein [Pirellulales bacterium]
MPVSQVTSVLGAARAAQAAASAVAGKVAQAVGFDQILAGSPDVPSESLETITERVVTGIGNQLDKFGIETNPLLELSVESSGRLSVTSQHDQAARIESILAADENLTRLAEQLHRIGGRVQLRIGPKSEQT